MNGSKRVLVTGYGGFLGKEIVRQLLESGYQVRGVARGIYPELAIDPFVPIFPAKTICPLPKIAMLLSTPLRWPVSGGRGAIITRSIPGLLRI